MNKSLSQNLKMVHVCTLCIATGVAQGAQGGHAPSPVDR